MEETFMTELWIYLIVDLKSMHVESLIMTAVTIIIKNIGTVCIANKVYSYACKTKKIHIGTVLPIMLGPHSSYYPT